MKYLILVITFVVMGCSSDVTRKAAKNDGALTIKKDQGIDFTRHQITDPGNFANSDIYAVDNGHALKLLSGGVKSEISGKFTSTSSQPVTWFMTGGVAEEFSSLAEIPVELPKKPYQPLLHAKKGNGFIVKNAQGFGYTRGRIVDSAPSFVTIEFDFPNL